MTGTVYGSQSCHVKEGAKSASFANLCLLLICTGWWLSELWLKGCHLQTHN